MADRSKMLTLPVDWVVTLLVWLFFGLVEPVLFFFPYMGAGLFSTDREKAFQCLNHAYFRVFFWWVSLVAPGLKLRIPRELRAIRSSVVICNHLSYLDSILLVSLLPRHKTIVKPGLLRLPLMGWAVRFAGYLPFTENQASMANMVEQMDKIKDYLQSGGNLFVFPEGTRSRDGQVGNFMKGAFGIARNCQAPIEVLRVTGTNRLFPPGSWLLHCGFRNTIELSRLTTLTPQEVAAGQNSIKLADQVRGWYINPAPPAHPPQPDDPRLSEPG